MNRSSGKGGGNPASAPHPSVASLHALKALCAFLVVSIHTGGPLQNDLLYPLLRLAVPLFFMISGYFLYAPDRGERIRRCKRWLRKIGVLTVAANLFYLTVATALRFAGVGDAFPTFDLRAVVLLVLTGETISLHLWYLTALIEVLALFLLLFRFGSERLLRIVLPLALCLSLLFGRYAFLLPEDLHCFHLSRGFAGIGLLCFGIGYLIRRFEPDIPQGRMRLWGHPALFATLLALSAAEHALLNRFAGPQQGDVVFFTIPAAVSLFVCALRHPDLGRGSMAATIGRRYATDIYVFHLFVGLVLTVALRRLAGISLPALAVPFAVFLGSWPLAALAGRLRRLRFKPAAE